MTIRYNFRLAPELIWFVLISAGVPALQALSQITGVADLGNPNFWDGILGAAIRAGAAALIAAFTDGFQMPGVPKEASPLDGTPTQG